MTAAPTVLITGCSSGIGRAAAFHFARHGFNVVATVRQNYEQLALYAELHQASLQTHVVTCDVTKEDDLQALVASAKARFGAVDVLINNAGYGQFGGIEVVTLDEARAEFAVNTFAPARLAALVLPLVREQGGGKIINLSSVAGRVVLPWGGWYAASKFALEALTDALRLECRPFNVHVVSVLAGPVATKFVSKVRLSEPHASHPDVYHRAHQHALERKSRPRPGAWSAEQVADLLLRIAVSKRPRTRYVTGVTARAALLLRKYLPDRVWDKLILRAYGASALLTNSNR